MIVTERSRYGVILANSAGRTLYMTTGKCLTATCSTRWPPLVVTTVPTFGAGVKTALLGDFVRPDKSHQLTYGKHPLYTFFADKGRGQTHGEGLHTPWGTWYVVSATTGRPVAPKAPAKKKPTGGSGY